MPKDDDRKSLRDTVARVRARWLKRVMYEPTATPTEKCFAYIVSDHLNCVTLDSWQAPKRSAVLLGKSKKTCERAARALERRGFLVIRRDRKHLHRYAPVFSSCDLDKIVPEKGQEVLANMDTVVHESILSIQAQSPTPTEAGEGKKSINEYDRRSRGQIELRLIEMLGHGGADLLARLSALDDSIVERLCRAYVFGYLGKAELAAARLAAAHM